MKIEKKYIVSLVPTLILVSSLTACNDSNNQIPPAKVLNKAMINGTWNCQYVEEGDKKFNVNTHYNKDGTLKIDASVIYYRPNETENALYNITSTGTWELKGNTIIRYFKDTTITGENETGRDMIDYMEGKISNNRVYRDKVLDISKTEMTVEDENYETDTCTKVH